MYRSLLIVAISVLTVGCDKLEDSTRTEASLTDQPLVVPLSGKAPWRVAVSSAQQSDVLEQGSASLNDSKITAHSEKREKGEHMLALSFKDSWQVQLTVESQPLDLTPYIDNGALAFDINPLNVAQAGLDVNVNCTEFCQYPYRLREWAMEREGQGWQSINIALSCLLPQQDNHTQIMKPFVLNAGGTGDIEIRNVRFVDHVKNTLECPQNLSVTPVELNEPWAVQWWKPRHEQKRQQAASSTADLVLIGDSITHSWEDVGKNVWDENFSDIETLNLGFAGDRTENVLWRLEHGELQNQSAKLTMIMIGTNNTGHRMEKPEAIRDGVAAIIDKVKKEMPETRIVLQAIFPRGATPEDPMRQNNQAANQLLKQLAEEKNVEFANINQALLEEDGELSEDIMPDLLHPNEEGYRIWAKQIMPYIDKHVRPQNSAE